MQFYSSLEQGFSPFVAHQNHLGNLKSRCLDVPPPSILIELIYIGASFKDSPGDCYVKLGLRTTGLDFSTWLLSCFSL